jgi:hypothetical protein
VFKQSLAIWNFGISKYFMKTPGHKGMRKVISFPNGMFASDYKMIEMTVSIEGR